MGSTKIVVLQLKKIIYTAFFIALGIILIILLIFMFTNNKKEETTPTMRYVPGVYSSSVYLDNQPINVEVIVDSNHINSVKIKNMNTATEILYPLLEPAMSNIESQLINDSGINNLIIESKHTHTSTLLLDAIDKALFKAQVEQELHN